MYTKDVRPSTERRESCADVSRTETGPCAAGGARHCTAEEECTVAAVVPIVGNLQDAQAHTGGVKNNYELWCLT
jgi:hypothetical protein